MRDKEIEVRKMADTKVTFFMIVTDPDILIADYSVKSYCKIQGIPFKLIVYSNWVNAENRRHYFSKWRKLDFVEIIENEWQTDNKPNDPHLEGPYEKCTTIWDRELKKIKSPYYATVDADFEILDAKFIPVMLALLDANSNLVALSTDYSPQRTYYDTYSGQTVHGNERWHTWFCIYRAETLECEGSHRYYEEIIPGSVSRNIWDSSAYFQKKLKENYKYEFSVLDSMYQPCFIHYGAFAKNRDLDRSNIGLYRFFKIIAKTGVLGLRNKYTCKLGYFGDKIFFGNVDRSRYWNGFGKREEK